MRGNLMGKRVDFSARTVITGDPNLVRPALHGSMRCSSAVGPAARQLGLHPSAALLNV